MKSAQGLREASNSVQRYDYKMTLEEKILAGYYRPLNKENQALRAQGLYIEGLGTIDNL